MYTVTRECLAQSAKKSSGLPVMKNLDIVDALFEVISETLSKGNKVKIRKFGSFEAVKRCKRVGRNPKNLVEALIPERLVVKFKISTTLKAAVYKTTSLIG